VLERPDGDPATPRTVCPGVHTLSSDAGDHTVVWWSPEPSLLPLDVQPSFGLRRDDLIVRDVPPTVLRRHLDAYVSWKQGRQAAIASASVPSIRLVTATEAASSEFATDGQSPSPSGVIVEHVALDADRTRPAGRRFGSLVHAVLADVPLDDATMAGQLAAAHGRLLAATAEEVSAAEQLVTRVLQHPLLAQAARAAAAGRCVRETAVTLRGEDGALIEGTVDLAFDIGGEQVVVDFKTDAPEGERLARYQKQVALYARAIQQVSGVPVRAVLMTV
jgi:ATP-dependent exoDNAse (exonuclease V) beta subunit